MTMWRTLSVRVLPQAHCILHVDEAGVFAQLPVRVVGDPPLPVIGINHFPGRQEREVDSGSNKTWKQWRGNVIRKETGETWSDRLDLSLCQVYKRGIYKNWMSIDKLRMEIIVEAVSHDFLDVYTVICNLIFTNYLRVIIFISLFGWITNCPKYDFFFFISCDQWAVQSSTEASDNVTVVIFYYLLFQSLFQCERCLNRNGWESYVHTPTRIITSHVMWYKFTRVSCFHLCWLELESIDTYHCCRVTWDCYCVRVNPHIPCFTFHFLSLTFSRNLFCMHLCSSWFF